MKQTDGNLSNITYYFVIAIAAFATLTLQLIQTRILSSLFMNHVVYLTITIALLGFGISGVLISIFYKRIENQIDLTVTALMGFICLTPACISAASYSTIIFPPNHFLLTLCFCYLVLIIPFVCSGTVIGTIFMLQGHNSYRLYFADLSASALGCLFLLSSWDHWGRKPWSGLYHWFLCSGSLR